MLTRLRQARLLWPTLMTLAALPVLIELGNWQWQRKTWKDGLISRLEARTHAPPVSFEDALKRYQATQDVEYLRVKVRGHFLHDKERYLYAPDERMGPGYQVITPLMQPNNVVLLVNRGFVPDELRDPGKRSAGQLSGEVEVTGLARTSEVPGTFTPRNDEKRNLWFWRDVGGMFKSAFEKVDGPVIPFMIDAEAEPQNPGGWPKGGTTLVHLPNRHLEYVLTWYGLAAALLAIYGIFAHGRLRGEQ